MDDQGYQYVKGEMGFTSVLATIETEMAAGSTAQSPHSREGGDHMGRLEPGRADAVLDLSGSVRRACLGGRWGMVDTAAPIAATPAVPAAATVGNAADAAATATLCRFKADAVEQAAALIIEERLMDVDADPGWLSRKEELELARDLLTEEPREPLAAVLALMALDRAVRDQNCPFCLIPGLQIVRLEVIDVVVCRVCLEVPIRKWKKLKSILQEMHWSCDLHDLVRDRLDSVLWSISL